MTNKEMLQTLNQFFCSDSLTIWNGTESDITLTPQQANAIARVICIAAEMRADLGLESQYRLLSMNKYDATVKGEDK